MDHEPVAAKGPKLDWRHPGAHSKAKEKEKRETIVIVGLGWLSFDSLKLLLIAALAIPGILKGK